jgi:Rieske Fe-S protein
MNGMADTFEDRVVECPVHGARFDVTDGSVVRRPALRPLWTFPVSDETGSDPSNSEGSKVRIRVHLPVPV